VLEIHRSLEGLNGTTHAWSAELPEHGLNLDRGMKTSLLRFIWGQPLGVWASFRSMHPEKARLGTISLFSVVVVPFEQIFDMIGSTAVF
jgi:hypothetical protein